MLIIRLHVSGYEGYVTPIGDVDVERVDRFREALASVIACGCSDVQVDASRLRHMTAAGLGVLVEMRKRLTSVGGCLRITNPSPAVAGLLKLTRLDTLLQIERRPNLKPVAAVA